MREENLFSTVSVIGLGYIGLPTAAVIANQKVNVIGVDVNENTIETINQGKIHIVEPDLDRLVHDVVAQGYLRATSRPESSDAFLITVPTPFIEGVNGQHEPDLSFIKSASKSIAPVLKKGDLIILESTSPVGATEQMSEWLAEIRPDLKFPHTHGEDGDICIAYCPERVLPGQILRELVENDRVIGGITPKCSKAAAKLYKIFVNGQCIITNARTAEMCKLSENSFRDVNIAFANELSMICDKLSINVWELIKLANRHPRVNILQPGPGVGGHCIAVDPWFIVSSAPEEARLIRIAREVNDLKPNWVMKKIGHEITRLLKNDSHKSIENITIAVFGITFKPDIDDCRESPAIKIVESLIHNYSCKLMVVDPYVFDLPHSIQGAQLVQVEQAINADLIILLVDHKQFKEMLRPNTPFLDFKGVWKNQ
jgi:UDP-N-acetyl-D-mannosaminuronic acid dehydrogenase